MAFSSITLPWLIYLPEEDYIKDRGVWGAGFTVGGEYTVGCGGGL